MLQGSRDATSKCVGDADAIRGKPGGATSNGSSRAGAMRSLHCNGTLYNCFTAKHMVCFRYL